MIVQNERLCHKTHEKVTEGFVNFWRFASPVASLSKQCRGFCVPRVEAGSMKVSAISLTGCVLLLVPLPPPSSRHPWICIGLPILIESCVMWELLQRYSFQFLASLAFYTSGIWVGSDLCGTSQANWLGCRLRKIQLFKGARQSGRHKKIKKAVQCLSEGSFAVYCPLFSSSTYPCTRKMWS